ncbi:MAG: secretin and TonB N-terminal domain-containing protein [Candidatus Omnitrophica bacterium]|nr:secretin and TonB N-terminal domain-containing protein [Candidatus Omnitrophota bacterium]
MGYKRAARLSRKLLIMVLVIIFIAPPLALIQAFAEEGKAETLPEKPASAVSVPAEKAQDVSAQPVAKSGVAPALPEPPAQEEAKPVEVLPVEPGNVTVNFKGAEIKTVLAYISEVAGVDIVSAPDVKGIIDLRLTNKPWKAALDIIVRNYGFAYEREGDIIRVVTLDKLKQEELTTQAFSLNYSKSKEVVAALKNIVGERGNIVFDDRTNTVIVTDIPTNIYRIGQIIGRLDKRTEQVLIEARIIETVLGNDEKLGIDWTAKMTVSGASRPTTMPFNFFNNDDWKFLDKMIPWDQTNAPTVIALPGTQGTQTVTPANFPVSNAGINVKSFPLALADSFSFGTLDFSQFKAVLELLKSRADTDTISNPRIATLNNNKATINVGEIIYIPKFERNSTTGKMEITGYDQTNSGIVLDVTPHINDVGEIALDLVPQIKEYLGTSPIAPGSDIFAPLFRTREAKTQVMVKNSQTIFIGGLISEKEVDKRTKLPFIGDMLGDVPYLGLLVSHKDIVKQRVELIFFITVNIMSPGTAIEGAPLASKAYVPVFTDTQRGNTAADKKRLKKTY